MSKKVIGFALSAAMAGLLACAPAWSAVSSQEAARLGADLTPLGGEKAGNADGTIPEWTGGIKSAADAGFPNYRSGEHHPDPFAADKHGSVADQADITKRSAAPGLCIPAQRQQLAGAPNQQGVAHLCGASLVGARSPAP